MQYAVHAPDGQILRIVRMTFRADVEYAARMERASVQAGDGEAVVELPEDFQGNDLTHRIENGAAVAI
jgi:hypothetical protein